MLPRRAFLASAALAALPFRLRAETKLPPVRAITKGPKFHWFGYYDKLQFDPTSRYALGMAVDFEGRTPKDDDAVSIGMIDLHDKDRWIELGTSKAWCWQQGCMLQWVPGSKTEILWNDREGDRFVCRILDTATRKLRTIPEPVYALAPDGKSGIAADFRRLHDTRPGYGYAGVDDPNHLELAPKESGVWSVDLSTGKQKLLISIFDAGRLGEPDPSMAGAKHWFNHLLYNHSGTRFVFLHRWRPKDNATAPFRTRMITANADGTDPYVLDASGYTSHFIWRGDDRILAWTRPVKKENGFWLFKDKTDEIEQVGKGVMTENGHCTYLRGSEWILNDTYPDKERLQHPYLYRVKDGAKFPLGDFRSPKEYAGEWRCDTHPRSSPDGKWAVIDSPHDGGRQMYLIDLRGIVEG